MSSPNSGGRAPARIGLALVLLAAASTYGCSRMQISDLDPCNGKSDWACIESVPVYSTRSAAIDIQPARGDRAEVELLRRHKAIVAADRQHRIHSMTGIGWNGTGAAEILRGKLLKRYRKVAQAARPLSHSGLRPVGSGKTSRLVRKYDQDWRFARQVLYLGGEPANRTKQFSFATVQAFEAEIAFRSIALHPLNVRGWCEGPVRLHNFANDRNIGPGEEFRFTVAARERDEMENRIAPAPGTDSCMLEISNNSGRIVDRIGIARETPFAEIDGRYDVCGMPPAGMSSPLERVFYADRWLSQTCLMKPRKFRPLTGAREGYNAKINALLGQDLPDRFIDAGDPHAPIDFSQAPDLSMIMVSYLDIKADFSGFILLRLLRHHAERGTPIRIIVTEILERKKDRALLEQLAADHPNVQLQEFRWRPSRGSGYDEKLSGFYKTNHIKVLLTLSRDGKASRLILGGRNIHDGFLYKKALDLTRYPDLHTYTGTNGLSLNYYSNYRDLDLEIADPDAVKTIAAHFSTVWHRDHETNVSPPFSVSRITGKPQTGFRHFISIPYADGQALEKYYVNLMDAAQHKIEIVNPYLNPTPEIDAAFERALARGVAITIVARINLRGDLGGTVLTELNELFVEKFAGRISMFEYREPAVVLHSKLLMIDEKLVVMSSVNFNNRSFVHDSENGVAIYDPAEYRKFKAIFEEYRSQSDPLSADVDVPFLYRRLLGIDLFNSAL